MTLAELGLVIVAITGPAAIASFALRRKSETGQKLLGHLMALCALSLLTLACFVVSGVVVNPPTLATPLIGLGMAAVIMFWFGPALMWLAGRVSQEGHARGISQLRELPLWSVVLAIVVGAVCEEYLYRGIAWPLLSGSLGGLLAGLAVSAAFGLAHWPLWGPGPAVSTGVAGAAFTMCYAMHGDLHANILAHVIADFMGLIAPRLAERRSHP